MHLPTISASSPCLADIFDACDGPLLAQTLDTDFLVTLLFDTLTRCIKAETGRASCCSESNIAADTVLKPLVL